MANNNSNAHDLLYPSEDGTAYDVRIWGDFVFVKTDPLSVSGPHSASGDPDTPLSASEIKALENLLAEREQRLAQARSEVETLPGEISRIRAAVSTAKANLEEFTNQVYAAIEEATEQDLIKTRFG